MAFEMELIAGRFPDQPDYWLAYWIACFENIAKHADNILLVAQDKLRANPDGIMSTVLEGLSLSRPGPTGWQDVFLTNPDRAIDGLFDGTLIARARALYSSLHDRSLGY